MTDALFGRDRRNRLEALVFAALIAVLAYALGSVALLAVAQLAESLGIEVFGRSDRLVLLGTIALQGIGFGGMAIAYLSLAGGGRLVRVGPPSVRDVVVVAGGYVLIGLTFLGVSALYAALNVPVASSDIVQTGFRNPDLLLLLVPLSILLVGPAEELLYRGVIQGRLRRVLGPAGAIVATSALFAPIHAFGLSGSALGVLAMLLTIFLLSVVLGALYEYTGNLLVPALVHGLYNASQFVLAYVETTGGLPVGI